MGKLFKLLTVIAVLFFLYYMAKRFFLHRKLKQQGQTLPKERFRPITLLSILMIVMYGGYVIYYLVWK
ncbi:hypothetical protein [Galenea microaerophila]